MGEVRERVREGACALPREQGENDGQFNIPWQPSASASGHKLPFVSAYSPAAIRLRAARSQSPTPQSFRTKRNKWIVGVSESIDDKVSCSVSSAEIFHEKVSYIAGRSTNFKFFT